MHDIEIGCFPQMTWRKGDQELESNDRVVMEMGSDHVTLTLRRCDVTDAGTYHVTLENEHGAGTAEATAQVSGEN